MVSNRALGCDSLDLKSRRQTSYMRRRQTRWLIDVYHLCFLITSEPYTIWIFISESAISLTTIFQIVYNFNGECSFHCIYVRLYEVTLYEVTMNKSCQIWLLILFAGRVIYQWNSRYTPQQSNTKRSDIFQRSACKGKIDNILAKNGLEVFILDHAEQGSQSQWPGYKPVLLLWPKYLNLRLSTSLPPPLFKSQ